MMRKIIIVALVTALCAAVLFGVVWAYDTWHAGIRAEGKVEGLAEGRAEIQAKWDADRAQALRLQVDQARSNAAETLRRLDKHKENQLAQDAYLARVARDRDALRAERDGLQLRAARYLDAAGCGALAGDSALECVRAATAKVVDVLGRCSSRLVDLAAAADDARARGLKCEADYDALTPAAGVP